ncbi:MAG: CYTH domain-containing protein [archaeon]
MEIEIRSFVKDFGYLKHQLDKLKAKKIDETEIEDQWFCKKNIHSYKETKMNKVGSIGLRIRLQKGRPAELNVKTIVSKKDHQVFDEEEIVIEDAGNMRSILESLDFKVFCVLKKNRETYQFENMKINLEDIDNFPPCVEIEILDTKNFNKNRKKIHKILDQLGLDKKDRITTSITSLYMEKFAFKS